MEKYEQRQVRTQNFLLVGGLVGGANTETIYL
jgi:hypothetical protein